LDLVTHVYHFTPITFRLSTTSHDSLVKIWDASLEVMDNEVFSEDEDEEEDDEAKDDVQEQVELDGKRTRETDDEEEDDSEVEGVTGKDYNSDSDDSEDEKKRPRAKKTKKSFTVDRTIDFFAGLD
jgi:hypothetical protein